MSAGEKPFNTGVEIHEIQRVRVRIYRVTKTIVDCFRYRNKIGIDVALEALRGAIDKRMCSTAEISKLAHELRALRVVQPYLEATTTHGA